MISVDRMINIQQTFTTDTATVYKNEEVIGNIITDESFLKELNITREDIFITTKVAPRDQGRGKCRDGVLLSMKKLCVDYLDMVLIHWPGVEGVDQKSSKNLLLRNESWLDLQELVREGKIRSIGVSNYTRDHLEELLDSCNIKPVVNQVEFHPFLYQKDLLEFCRSKDVVLQAYSSLGTGKFSETLMSQEILKEIASTKDPYDIKEVSVAQVLLKWAIKHGVPVIPKTSSVDRLKENFDLFSFDLTDEDMVTIDDLNQNKHFAWNPHNIR